MKVKHWQVLFKIQFAIGLGYLIICSIPPSLLKDIYFGIALIVINGLFLWYSTKLVKNGRGEEIRP